jgi:hypothetical protein
MKNIKKLAAVLTALLMFFAAGFTPALAEENTDNSGYTLTVNETKAGHTFKVYQIFTGELTTDTSNGQTVTVLSNAVWGNGVTAAGQAALLGSDTTLADYLDTLEDSDDAKAMATTLKSNAGYLQNASDMTYVAAAEATDTTEAVTAHYELTGLAAGYYLVVDEANDTVQGTADEAYSGYIVKVVGDVTATPKKSVPTISKKVLDPDSSADGVIDANSVASATGWQDYADASTGEDVYFKITVTLGDDVDEYDQYYLKVTDTLVPTKNFNMNNNDMALVVTLDGTALTGEQYQKNVTQSRDGLMTIEIADVKALGATNGSVLTIIYKANLTTKAATAFAGNTNQVYLEYSNDPNSDTKGKTTTDDATVYTYELNIIKVNGTDSLPLAGAGFTLEKFIADENGATTVNGVKGSWVTFSNPIQSSQNPVPTLVKGTTNKFQVVGIDAGTYRLTETTTPSGYNTMDPIIFTVTASHKANESDTTTNSLTVATANTTDPTITVDTSNNMNVTIANYKGSTLPETGGAGTTMLYTAGAVLCCGAVVIFLASKKAQRD